MPKYILVRTVGEVSEKEIEAAAVRSLATLDEMTGVRWIRSYYSAEEGKLYCEYEAPSVDLVYEHARKAQLPLDHCSVVRELEPAMFR
ncbi:DUF4242 domain-containing protein [Rubrobacter indicoceani]|uniref:DUF4242 domain-containing protein n=1 Tax=Rubrobacter indicoceani TaxID=2051957 RepID=UPI000E5A2CED|nr:DUF4242 domain-containing protein [Rubrobacter indicoceani]